MSQVKERASQVRDRATEVKAKATEVSDRATTEVAHRPVIAHGIRAYNRYKGRLGKQFAGAITYFSILAIVPIIMLAFSALGFALVVVAPDKLDEVLAQVDKALSGIDPTTKEKIGDLIKNALSNYAAIGIAGAVSALYSGAGWIRNLKIAVRAQWRQAFDLRIRSGRYVIHMIANAGIMIAMLVMIAVTFALASLSTSLSDNIVEWLGLGDVGWVQPALRLVPIAVSIVAGWLIFIFLYTVLPETRERWKLVAQGSLIGAIGLGLLQYLTSFLIAWFAGNPASALFGPIIILMLFFNLFARLILLIASWIGTAEHPSEPDFIDTTSSFRVAADAPVLGLAATVADDDLAELTSAGRSRRADDGDGDRVWSSTPGLVTEEVAVRTARAASGFGYLVGAATGLGAGSALARLRMRLRR